MKKLFPLYQKIFEELKKIFKFFKKNLDKFNETFPRISQNIQLTFIYFFALIDLMFSVLNNVFAMGYFPEFLIPLTPVIKGVFLSPFFSMWASPEKVFFMSYVTLELIVIRSALGFSKLVKYNVLLIFALLMLQGLTVSYWDLMFNREVTHSIAKWAFDHGILIYTDKTLAITFFLNTFIIFILLYCFLYVQAILGKFALIPGMAWLTDSIAFWLRIKTPTMRIGKRKNEIEEDKEKDVE